MTQRFFFKFTAIVLTVILVSLMFLPFVWAALTFKEGAWQYGYAFLEINWKTNLLVSLAFGLTFGVWNAFEFERHRTVDIRQYLKPKQRYHFKTSEPVSMEQLRNEVESHIIRKRWKVKRWTDTGVEIRRKNIFMDDVVKIKIIPQGLEISSQPKWKILVVDMARNLDNIEDVSSRLKHLK